ncbi:MAG: elongation factor P [Clostridiales bacterium]|jgi:elongation factor P|nr:elongation factor P [Clostridiales bacterium]MDY4655039.1 elongation factor P [Eubacteriales bacterium]
MAYIMAGDFRKGITFELDSTVQVIVDFQHVKPGKGAAFVRAKIRNVMTGGVIERTFNPSEKYELAHIDRKKMSYSYNDGDLYYFMDAETFDMVPLNEEIVKDALRFIREGDVCDIAFYKGNAFSCDPQNFVELKVVDAEPGIPGATAQPGSKSATLETGYVIQVPLFVNAGETIRVDTRDGSYMSRV